MRKKEEPEFLVETKNYVMDSKTGKKITQKYIGDGWEIVSAVPERFWRSTQVVFRKPNPKYTG